MKKLNLIVHSTSEYIDEKGKIRVKGTLDGEFAFAKGIDFVANKDEFNPGDRIEIIITNLNKPDNKSKEKK